MKRIAVLGQSPLWASGVAAALSAQPGWQAQASCDGADAAVVQVAAAGDAPAGLPSVLVGDDLREAAGRFASGAPLALLSPAASAEALCAAVAAVLQGLSVRDAVHAAAWGLHATAAEHEPLTPRELEVFELLGKGLSNRDIGGVLGISAHTAKFHVGQILAKVGAATRAEAVRAGLQMGVIGL